MLVFRHENLMEFSRSRSPSSPRGNGGRLHDREPHEPERITHEPPKENTTGLLDSSSKGSSSGATGTTRGSAGASSPWKRRSSGAACTSCLPSSRSWRCPRRTSWPTAPPTRLPTWLHRRAWPRGSPHAPPHPEPRENSAPGGRWGPVYGELLTFDDPETRLPAIDRLEGFLPDWSSLYRRVLVPNIIHGGTVPVWLYIRGRISEDRVTPLECGRWPSRLDPV